MSARNGRARTENRRRAILARDGDLCWICEEPLGDDMTIEHVVERAEGGRNALFNLRLTHSECNNRRSNRARLLREPVYFERMTIAITKEKF